MSFFPELQKYFTQNGLPSYRYDQLYQAITHDLTSDFSQISTFSKEMRQRLADFFPGFFPKLIKTDVTAGCTKFLFQFNDGLAVETVLIQNPKSGANTVCFSTQVGCSLNCRFCATGKMGFHRHLSYWEIASQVLFVANFLKDTGCRVTNVVAMGMGEPFLNFDNLISALRLLNDGRGFNLAARHISVSTAGITPAILRFARIPEQFNLAISLHSPFQEQRQDLMPIAKKYEMVELIRAANDYIKITNRKVMLEYVLINNINTSRGHLEAVAEIANKSLFQVNLVNYNIAGDEFKPVSGKRAKEMLDYLKSAGVNTTLRRSAGSKIKAACGQLSSDAKIQTQR